MRGRTVPSGRLDGAKIEMPEYEVAKALWEFARDDDRLMLDERRKETFLEGYSTTGPIKAMIYTCI